MSETAMLRCTVIVCTQDRLSELERCLLHLKRVSYREMKILVVDSAPRRATAREVAERFHAQYLHLGVPGLSRARNAGARTSNSEIVAFLDDDAFPRADWLEALLGPFHDPTVAATTGSIYPPEPISEAGRTWEQLGGFRPSQTDPRTVDRSTPGWFAAANFGALGNGSNMAFRTNVFESWRGFNEELGRGERIPSGEEHFAFFELIDREYRIVHVPEAVVFHPVPQTVSELEHRFLNTLQENGMYLAYLFQHLPNYRRELYRLAWKYFRNLLKFRGKPAELSGVGISRWRQILAVTRGVLRYWRGS